jgi:hypothetical protein
VRASRRSGARWATSADFSGDRRWRAGTRRERRQYGQGSPSAFDPSPAHKARTYDYLPGGSSKDGSRLSSRRTPKPTRIRPGFQARQAGRPGSSARRSAASAGSHGTGAYLRPLSQGDRDRIAAVLDAAGIRDVADGLPVSAALRRYAASITTGQQYGIRRVGLYLSRQGEDITWDVRDFLGQLGARERHRLGRASDSGADDAGQMELRILKRSPGPGGWITRNRRVQRTSAQLRTTMSAIRPLGGAGFPGNEYVTGDYSSGQDGETRYATFRGRTASYAGVTLALLGNRVWIQG